MAMRKRDVATMVTLESIQHPVRGELREVEAFIRNILLSEFHFHEEIAEHLTNMKGKLFRPTLLLLSGNITDGEKHPGSLVPMAVVIEMIHTATLVHDDFIDNATVRRGLPTLNDRWSDQVSVIMGDYLYSRSLIEMVGIGDLEVMRIVSEACRRIALGELMELNLTSSLDQTEEQYYETIRHKTATLIAASCEGGAVLSSSEHREKLRMYGEYLGMAYQIVDDIFDYKGRTSVLGKAIGTDLREKKATLPLIHSLKTMSDRERTFVEDVFRRQEICEADITEVSRIIERHGGFDHAMRQAVSFAEKARTTMEDIEPSRCRESLLGAVDYVVERDR
jgi:octaprenyl-diphosphate synthase